MTGSYPDMLTELLALGICPLSGAFIERQVAFVRSRQLTDGGFAGRRGNADTYYTDFALRLLALCAPRDAACRRAVGYLEALASPVTVVECLSRLSAARSLRQCGQPVAVPGDITACLAPQRLPQGGFARPGGAGISAYQTFLAAVCYALHGTDFPDGEGAVAGLATLQCADGGFCDVAGDMEGQTNATAAVLALLTLQDAVCEDQVLPALAFLARMQDADGGLRAQPAAPMGDLLSTFTGLLSLMTLGGMTDLDVPAIGRFVRALALPDGGFRACLVDDAADVEYTYYGVGVLALLRAYVDAA